jgi:predicted transcriptional regulator of viral defense system
MGIERRTRRLEQALADLAGRQHGVVARRQLLEIGFGPRAIARRLESGRLHSLHRGVYAVGHRVVACEGRWMAAVLAIGPGSALSHRSAAAHWGLLSLRGGAVHVTGERAVRERPGIIAHCSRLPSDETTTLDGVPVTTVPRTVLDLAVMAPRRSIEQALNEAERRQLTDPLSLNDLVARYRGRRGLATLRTVLADRTPGITRSELEDRFLAFLDRAGLPRPELNAAIHLDDRFIEVDCVWRRQKLVVELDGRSTHDTADAFYGDRARDRALLVAGWSTVRVTWRDLDAEADRLAKELRALLTPAR